MYCAGCADNEAKLAGSCLALVLVNSRSVTREIWSSLQITVLDLRLDWCCSLCDGPWWCSGAERVMDESRPAASEHTRQLTHPVQYSPEGRPTGPPQDKVLLHCWARVLFILSLPIAHS